VKKINLLLKTYPIKFVFITGDVTNSATTGQYAEVRKILDELEVNYYPSLGNHDVWQYNSSWEEQNPTGDALFAKTFQDRLSQVTFYNNLTVWNPEQDINSWFQNWELRVGGISFISLDWNSRHPAVWELGYKGAMPGAQLHNFTGGTLPFLASRLQVIPDNIKTIVFLQHHPYRSPWYVPEWIYGFSTDQKDAVRYLLTYYQPLDRYWGVFAGHWHRWYNGTAFDEWPKFWEWETDACKNNAAITLVTVEDDKIVDTQQFTG